MYMEPEESNAIVKWLGQLLKTAAFVIYEQVGHECAVAQQLDLLYMHRLLTLWSWNLETSFCSS